jgi:ABC-type protease/lipase transport system fused ATPase/permease subunit
MPQVTRSVSRAETWFHDSCSGPAGLSGTAAATWELLHRATVAEACKSGLALLAVRDASVAVSSIAHVALMCAGAHLMIAGVIGAGHFIAAILVTVRLTSALTDVCDARPQLSAARASLKQLMTLPSDAPTTGKLGSGPLALSNVSFIYPGRNAAALTDITLAVEPGRCLGITGGACSGKSTLLAAFAGMIEPNSGLALIGGQLIASVQRTSPKPPIGYMSLTTPLFEGTVEQNIARFMQTSGMPVATAALRAGVHDIIAALPNGYGTQVGPDGRLLSPIERAAVSLARALHREPLVCVLDHPEAALDDVGIIRFVETLRAMKQDGVALVLATNDPRIAALSDEVIVLKNGHIEARYISSHTAGLAHHVQAA